MSETKARHVWRMKIERSVIIYRLFRLISNQTKCREEIWVMDGDGEVKGRRRDDERGREGRWRGREVEREGYWVAPR